MLISYGWKCGKSKLLREDTTLAKAWLSRVPRTYTGVTFVGCEFDNPLPRCLSPCSKIDLRCRFSQTPRAGLTGLQRAQKLFTDGTLHQIAASVEYERPVLVAIGSYLLKEVLPASRGLTERRVTHADVAALEPTRLSGPMLHTRREPRAGVTRRIDAGHDRTFFHGFTKRGGLHVPQLSRPAFAAASL